MACHSLKKEKMCSQLLKKCLHRRRFVVVPFRQMTICQVNRQATFFKIVLFLHFQMCMTRLTWIHSFTCIMLCTLEYLKWLLTFVLRTLTAFLLIWIWKIFYFSSVRLIFFTHSQLLLIFWAALETAMPCILISWFYNFRLVFRLHLSPSLSTLSKYLDDGLHLICLNTQTSSRKKRNNVEDSPTLCHCLLSHFVCSSTEET